MSVENTGGCPLPKRRAHQALPEAPPTVSPYPSRCTATKSGTSFRVLPGGQNRWAAGAGVAVIALAVPVTAYGVVHGEPAHGDKIEGTFAGTEAWADSPSGELAFSVDSELEAVAAAASRAKVRTPVEVSSCVSIDQSADGSRGRSQRFQAVWPLSEGAYEHTSSYGWRISPISGEALLHEGVDWAAPQGTPIYAAAAGVVTEVDYNGHSGYYVGLTHYTPDGGSFQTYYRHQTEGGIVVALGQEVAAGERIGTVGSTGWSTGAHLHFEVRLGPESPVDPVGWMNGLGAVHLGEVCS